MKLENSTFSIEVLIFKLFFDISKLLLNGMVTENDHRE